MIESVPEGIDLFPSSVIDVLAAACQLIDPHVDEDKRDGLRIQRRPLRLTDQTQTLGIFATHWQPDEQSVEIGRGMPGEPTFATYPIMVQSLVKDSDEERGVAMNSYFSSLVRNTLYRSSVIRDVLPTISSTVLGVREQVAHWGISRQHLQADALQGTFIYLSTIEFWVKTQTY